MSTDFAEHLTTEAGYHSLLRLIKPPYHPLLPVPTREQCQHKVYTAGDQALLDVFEGRSAAITREKADPYEYGYDPDFWADADRILALKKDICVLGGNRSGKSEWAAKRCVQKVVKKEGAQVWCLSTSSDTSKRDQQKLIYKYLPLHWKTAKRSEICRITYNIKDGFADGTLVGPNSSEIHFLNYKQDRTVIEGGQVDLWWADELIPIDWVVTLRGRTVDRMGKGIVTFTPVNGFSATVGEYVTGATVAAYTDTSMEDLKVTKNWPGLEPGQVPYILECLDDSYGVIFFQPEWNPYISFEELRKLWKNRSSKDQLIRIHGVTRKTSGTVFPRFGKHNVIPHDSIPPASEGTNYHVTDFAWHRNWAMLWARCTEYKGRKRVFIYREWPDFQTYGEWAINSEKPDGEKGPAQTSMGWGINDYKREILRLEGHKQLLASGDVDAEVVETRYGDPRSGNAESLADEGATTIFLQLLGDVGAPSMDILPVVGKANRALISEGINLINVWLEYNEDKPLGIENEPEFFVSERCVNLISCMKIWTGVLPTGGYNEKGASKDFIDLLRYLAVMDISYLDPNRKRSRGGGAY